MAQFSKNVYDGDTIEMENGLTATVTFPIDEGCREPWTEEDGHGFIGHRRGLNCVGHIAKAPGERILWEDGSWAYVYDVKRTLAKARAEGWGARGAKPGMSARQITALAVAEDFERMRAYLADEWCYVIASVSISDSDGEELVRESLGGIESDAGEYMAEVANDCLAEALASLPDAINARLAENTARIANLSTLKTALEG